MPGDSPFRPYFGDLDPLLVLALVALLGAVSLAYLRARVGFAIVRGREDPRGPALAVCLAPLLVPPVILVDLLGGFPRDINVEAPLSLLFYPLIALVAEVVFHAVPLALLCLAGATWLTGAARESMVAWCLALVALVEPTFQVLHAPPASPPWATAYVGLHVLVFNLVALYLWRRHDFASAYVFRVTYYLGWHILWGYLRLQLLY